MRGRDGFTDKEGRDWLPDPTGRFTFRSKDGERWTALVCMTPSQDPGTDADGEALLAAGIGDTLAADDPRSDPTHEEETPHAPVTRWQHRVVATQLPGLEVWLDTQGRAGWELVSILDAAPADTDDEQVGLIAVFKRPG